MNVNILPLPFCCGVKVIGNFRFRELYNGYSLNSNLFKSQPSTFKIATFINTPECKRAYEIMCSKLKLVSQTEPKRNPNSGNLVFVCVFTNKDK